jgi:hypothetical protein
MGGTYVFNENGDQSVALYAFYAVEETAGGTAWKATAGYRDYFVMRDNLYIVGQQSDILGNLKNTVLRLKMWIQIMVLVF